MLVSSRELAGKRPIVERPPEVETRARISDWKIDTVMGGADKHGILPLVERKTGYVEIGKRPKRTKQESKASVVTI